MPGRRPINKGSFAGHFDGLVTHFSTGRTPTRRIRVKASKPKRKAKSAAALNQFLFECASQVERDRGSTAPSWLSPFRAALRSSLRW